MTMQRPADAATASEADRQGRVLGFLDGSRFGAANGGKRIDTHASVVFLGDDCVLKIKRAVKLPFLDYSTLEKRRHACEEELRVNAGNAPELYRRVVAITQADDGAFGWRHRHSSRMGGRNGALDEKGRLTALPRRSRRQSLAVAWPIRSCSPRQGAARHRRNLARLLLPSSTATPPVPPVLGLPAAIDRLDACSLIMSRCWRRCWAAAPDRVSSALP